MPDFRIRETGEVISDSEFRLRNKHTSFPRIIDEPLQDQFGIDMIFEGPQKQGPPPYSQTYRDGIECINGKWFTKYSIREQDKERIDKQQEGNINIVPSFIFCGEYTCVVSSIGFCQGATNKVGA